MDSYSLRIASAGDMRVTKYDGPTSISIEAIARHMLRSRKVVIVIYTGTWST